MLAIDSLSQTCYKSMLCPLRTSIRRTRDTVELGDCGTWRLKEKEGALSVTLSDRDRSGFTNKSAQTWCLGASIQNLTCFERNTFFTTRVVPAGLKLVPYLRKIAAMAMTSDNLRLIETPNYCR
jgi:hypothetical protein